MHLLLAVGTIGWGWGRGREWGKVFLGSTTRLGKFEILKEKFETNANPQKGCYYLVLHRFWLFPGGLG